MTEKIRDPDHAGMHLRESAPKKMPSGCPEGIFSPLAGELGFEPRQTESESVVLPLDDSPTFGLPAKSQP